MKRLLALGNFRKLWLSHVISSFGDALTNLALLITAQRLTGSTAAVATTAVAVALPQLLFGLFAGVLVDRWDRKRVMIASDLARSFLVLGFLAVSSPDRMWLLYVVAFVQASIGTLDNPARSSVVPQIVGTDDLLAANSFFQSTMIIVGVAGTATAGVIAGVFDTLAPAFVIDAASFALSAALVTRLTIEGRPARAATAGNVTSSMWSELSGGIRLITSSPMLRTVVITAGVVMLGLGAVNVLLVPFIVDDLAVPETWFGLLEAAQVTSMVLAGGLVAAAARRIRPGRLLVVGLTGVALVVAVMSLAQSVWHMIGLLFAVGWFVTPTQAAISTIVQTEVPLESLGRVSSSLGTISTTAQVASMALSGVAAAAFGVRSVFVAAGLIVLAAAGLSLIVQRSPGLKPVGTSL
ncbi:MAG TPA: MFS transporter [Acidimicrobiia bacterium]|nr:MFS transporter [Acidimicrobiia bacterium]